MKLKEIKEYWYNDKLKYYYFIDEQGKRQGKFIRYLENGTIWYEHYYKDDKWHGKLIDYYNNRIEYYNNGEEISKEKYLKNKIQLITSNPSRNKRMELVLKKLYNKK